MPPNPSRARRRSLLGLVVLLVASGCATDAPDAPACTVGCPTPGEHGKLWFKGALFSDQVDDRFADLDLAIKPIVAGGTEHVAAGVDVFAMQPPPSPYSVQGDGGVSATDVGAGAVTVRVGAPGVGHLTLDDGELSDRVAIESIALDHIELAEKASVRRGGYARPAERGPWVLHTGTALNAEVNLYAADGRRLVDEGLAIAGLTSVAWDVVQIPAVTDTAPIVLHATVGGAPHDITIPVTDKIDRIESVDPMIDQYNVIVANGGGEICVRGRVGDAYVIGGKFEITLSGGLGWDFGPHDGPNCWSFLVFSSGSVAISLDGVSRTYPVMNTQ